ncbi:hypothetical protein CW710_02610 [Candidatus Bathyarchaeota archaeon]|nr:hypothetical protein [Candidatus Bathyarchaeota archaeon]RJS73915.1 MAG: hypothetical protein CW710_02610 [Candidatus Bathyarchaeota archaeon]
MARYCPECGGELYYDPSLKIYVCRSCGSAYTHQELIDAWRKIRQQTVEEDRRKRLQREYLKWWLSKK